MPFWSRQSKTEETAPGSMLAVDAMRRFNAVWPRQERLVGWWPAVETVADLSKGINMKPAGLLLLTEELLVFAWVEHNDGIAFVTPLPRVLEWSYNDSYLNILAAHPRRRDLKLFSQHYVGLAGSASAPGYQEQFKDFSAQLAARLPDVQPDDSDLWPSDGRLGVGATWATSLSDEMLTRVLGHYRIVPADS